jgi:hypothetical protein
MPPTYQSVAEEAFDLDDADRLRLATELIDSVEGSSDDAWEAAWSEEIRARRAQGEKNGIPWADVRARVLERLTST